MIPSINDAIRDGRSIYLPVKPGPALLSEHGGIGHERVHLAATGDEDGFKSSGSEFITLKLSHDSNNRGPVAD